MTEDELRALLAEERVKAWTAREAEAELGLARGTVDMWVLRGHLKRWSVPGRPAMYWSDEVIDCMESSRRQRATRDQHGRFLPRVALG